jgi:hypothetical protein
MPAPQRKDNYMNNEMKLRETEKIIQRVILALGQAEVQPCKGSMRDWLVIGKKLAIQAEDILRKENRRKPKG